MIRPRFDDCGDDTNVIRIPREQFDRMARDHEAMEFIRANRGNVRISLVGGNTDRVDDWTVSGSVNFERFTTRTAADLTDAILDYRDEVQRRKEAT